MARKAEQHRVAERSGDQRLAGLHRDLPEIEPPARVLQRAADMVVIADRRAADGDDDVVTSRQLLERAREFCAVVGTMVWLAGGGDPSGETHARPGAMPFGILAGGGG